MATIYIDGEPHEVDGADNLLHTCLSLGLDVPHFCWHPALGSIGACRACAVKQYANADDKTGRIVMACMTQSADKTYISINDDEAKEFRKAVVEWLMASHPHDCPVCEEGGHCHLQDMTVMVQHNKRRYHYEKRTHLNQNLGPFINHEMNRCIACYRCVRYYSDYAGGTDFGVYGAHDNLYFGREHDGILESEFSGNLTEICPTGVFTDLTHSERYNRKWDMQFAPSVCQQCSVGCNIVPGERYGELRRVENRYHGEINHYFLCDRGRFGYGYVNREDRPRRPWQMVQGERKILDTDNALQTVSTALHTCNRVIGIGSPRASVQSNFALKELVGEKNFFSGFSAAKQTLVEHALRLLQQSPVRTPTLREIETCDAAFILGEDVTKTTPRVGLAVRQSVKNKGIQLAAANKIPSWQAVSVGDIAQRDKSPLYITSLAATKLDHIATANYRAAPEDLARLGFAVAHIIDDAAPAVPDLTEAQQALATQIAQDLLAAEHPLIISGTGCAHVPLMQAAANVAWALHRKQRASLLSLCLPEVNSMGAAMLGGRPINDALTCIEQATADGVIILENDLFRRAESELVEAALAKIKVLVVLDHQLTATVKKAHFVLPASSFAEGDGTVISMEGRAQRYFQVYDPAYYNPNCCLLHDSWAWLYALQDVMAQKPFKFVQFDDVTNKCAAAIPELARIRDASPDATYRVKGSKIARAPRRYSGRTAMRAKISVYEPGMPQDQDSPLAFSMEGHNSPHDFSSFASFAWAPGWNSPQAWTKFQDEAGGILRSGNSGVRLIEPQPEAAPAYETDIPSAFVQPEGLWRVAPRYHLFGSDELSALAPAAETVITAPYVTLSGPDAASLQAIEHAIVKVTLGTRSYSLRLHVSRSLPSGLVGLPVGVPGMPPTLSHTFAAISVDNAGF